MSDDMRLAETLEGIEQEILFFDKVLLIIGCWRHEARYRLLNIRNAQDSTLPPTSILSVPALTNTDLQLLARFSQNVQVSRSGSQHQQKDKSAVSISVTQPPPAPPISFLCLKIVSVRRYKDLVNDLGGLRGNVKSRQGPHCSGNPRFKFSRSFHDGFSIVNPSHDTSRNYDSDRPPLSTTQSQRCLSIDVSKSSLPPTSEFHLSPRLPLHPIESTRVVSDDPTVTFMKVPPPPSKFSLSDGPSPQMPTRLASSTSVYSTPPSLQLRGSLDKDHLTRHSPVSYRQLIQQASEGQSQNHDANAELHQNESCITQIARPKTNLSLEEPSETVTQAAKFQAQKQSPQNRTDSGIENLNIAQQGSSNDSYNAADHQHLFSPNRSVQAKAADSINLGRNFLTRRNAQKPVSNAPFVPTDAILFSNAEPQVYQRKRSSSVELIGQRPRQRQRTELDRVTTPPLNSIDREEGNIENLKSERQSPERFSHKRIITGKIDVYDAAPPLHQHRSFASPQQEFISSNTDKLAQFSQQTGHALSSRAPLLPTPLHEPARKYQSTINERSSRSASTDSANLTHSRCRRSVSGTPAVIAEGALSLSQESTERPIRRATHMQRQPGSYRTPAYKPLTPADRTALELRFCAQVAKIIGSKRCVSQAPLPHDNLPIFTRFKERFGAHKVESDEFDDDCGEEQYRSATDFVADAKRMLQNYVVLGHCSDCPFLKSGNPRVMCYRMRLASILDDRMRQLNDCLKACEYDCDADDPDSRLDLIDQWFHQDDFKEDGHWSGGR